jgi:hypothetical protein
MTFGYPLPLMTLTGLRLSPALDVVPESFAIDHHSLAILEDCDGPCYRCNRWRAKEVPNGENRDRALKQIELLDPVNHLAKQDEETFAKQWTGLALLTPSPDVYEKSSCRSVAKDRMRARGAPYIVRGLARNFFSSPYRFRPDSPQLAALTGVFLDEAHCLGAHGLSQNDKIMLGQIRRGQTALKKWD